MAPILQCAAAALTAAVLSLLLRRRNAELAALLSMAAVAVLLLSALQLASGLREMAETVRLISGEGEMLTGPVLKCLGIALVTRLAADLCRDASQSACASAVELTGTFCAMSVAMPLLMALLKTLGGML